MNIAFIAGYYLMFNTTYKLFMYIIQMSILIYRKVQYLTEREYL